MAFPSTSTEFALLDARASSGAFILPLTTDIPNRILNIKDPYGVFTQSSITVYTQGGETFDDGTNFKVMNNNYDQLQLYAGSTTKWYVTGGTLQDTVTAKSVVMSTLQTYNWASIEGPFTQYPSTFFPAPYGQVSLLDNVFASSTAALASTFIEFGNLNAMPSGVSTGTAFRYMLGVESDNPRGNGLAFKIKRWNNFGFSNSPLFYGANMSTVRDVVTINSQGNFGINMSTNTTPAFPFEVFGPARSGMVISTIGPNANSIIFTNQSYGIYYNITNSLFSGFTLPSVARPVDGWNVTLRNNTSMYISCIVTGTISSTPPTPQFIPPANSLTIAYETALNQYVLF